MRYTYILYYPDGEPEMAEETYDTEREAERQAWDAISCFELGREIMGMMGDRDEYIIEGDCDYEIVAIDDK